MSDYNSGRSNPSPAAGAKVSGPSDSAPVGVAATAEAGPAIHADPADPLATDHIASLPKMSLTAGLGSGDYVAISAAAIVALLLGIGSMLSFISDTLLVVPVAGVIVAFFALRNIRHSSGTLTGRGLAAIGLVLSLGIGSLTGGMAIKNAIHERQVSHEVDALCIRFGQYMKDHNYDAMYDLMTKRFKARIPHNAFVEKMRSIQDTYAAMAKRNMGPGEVTAMRGDGPIRLFEDPDSGIESVVTAVKFEFGSNTGLVQEEQINLRRTVDEWEIDDIPDLFPPPAAPGQH